MKVEDTNKRVNFHSIALLVITAICVAAAVIMTALYITKGTSAYKTIHDIYADETKLDTKVTVQGYYSNSRVNEDSTTSEGTESSSTSNTNDDETVYHFITAFDEAKCCSITIEFVSASGEYPGLGDYVEVTGTYSRYSEGTSTYSTVKDSTWKHITAPK